MDNNDRNNNEFNLFNENQETEKNIQNQNDTQETKTDSIINSIDEKKYNEMKELKESNYYKLMKKGNIIDVNYCNQWIVGKIMDLNDNGDILINCIENKNNNDEIFNANLFEKQENFRYFRCKTTGNSNNTIFIKSEDECSKNILNEKINLLKQIKKLNKDFSEKNLKNIFNENDPYFYFQLFNFNLIFDIDYFLNVHNSNSEYSTIYIILILEILSNFYYYISENYQLYTQFYNNKNTELEELFLVDINSAVLYFFYDSNIIFNKISGVKYRSTLKYYSRNYKSLISYYNKYYEDKKIKKYCFNYKKNFNFENYSFSNLITCFAIDNFINFKGVENLLNIIIQLSNMDLKFYYKIFDFLSLLFEYCKKINELYPNAFQEIIKIIRNKINQIENFENNNKLENLILTFKKSTDDENVANQLFEDLYLRLLFQKFNKGDFQQKQDILREFNNIIDAINFNEEFKKYVKENNKKKEEKKSELEIKYSNRNQEINYLTKPLFAHYLNKYDILDKILYSQSLHITFLSLSEKIIEILFVNDFGLEKDKKKEINTLKEKLIDFLILNFDNTKNNNEIQENKIYGNLICKLVCFMSNEKKILLYNKFKKYFENILNIIDLQFLMKFTKNILDLNNKKNKEIEIDYKNNNLNFNNECYFSFNEILKNFEDENENTNIQFKNEKNSFISEEILSFFSNEKCSDLFKEKIIFYSFINIMNQKNLVQNFNLLFMILNNNQNYKQILLKIQNKKKSTLFENMSNDLIKFINKLSDFAINNENDLETIIEGSYNVKEFMNSYLNLTLLLLNEEFFDLNNNNVSENFKRIFKQLKEFSFIKNLFLNEIIQNLNDFSPEIKKIFYENENLFEIDSISSFNLFKEIFLLIKKEKNKIFYFTTKRFRVSIEEPFEMKQIWNALNKNPNEEVQKEIIKFITYIYYNPKIFNIEKTLIYWKKIADDLGNNFNFIINQTEDENNDKIILGYLKLIKNLLENYGKYDYYLTENEQLINRNYKYNLQQLKNNNNNNNKSKKKNKKEKEEIIKENEKSEIYNLIDQFNGRMNVYNSQLFYEIRFLLARHFNLNANNIKFYNYVKDPKTKKNIKKYFDLNYDFENFNEIFTNKSFFTKYFSSDIQIGIENDKHPIFNLKSEFNPKNFIIESIVKYLSILLKKQDKIYSNEVWILIRDYLDNEKINNLEEKIKNIINNNLNDKEIFGFEEMNKNYISFVLKKLNNLLEKNEKIFKEKFFKSKIFKLIFEYFLKINIKYENIENLEKEINELNILNEFIKIILILNKNEIFLEKNFSILKDLFNNSINHFFNFDEEKNFEIKIKNKENFQQIQIFEEKIFSNLNTFFHNNNEKFLNLILKEEKFKNIFNFCANEGLIKAQNEEIKKIFEKIILDLFSIKNNKLIKNFCDFCINIFFLDSNIEKLNEIIYSSNFNVFIYFELISNLISFFFKNQISFDYEKFINKNLLPKILKEKEKKINESILSGFISIIYFIRLNLPNIKLFDSNSNEIDFTDFLLNEILFGKLNTNSKFNLPQITNQKISKLINHMIIESIFQNKIKRNEILKLLFNYQNYQFWKGNEILDWKQSFLIKSSEKKNKFFVGLKNLGCTCYMNTLFQIFFHTTEIRENLLKISVDKNDKKMFCIKFKKFLII